MGIATLMLLLVAQDIVPKAQLEPSAEPVTLEVGAHRVVLLDSHESVEVSVRTTLLGVAGTALGSGLTAWAYYGDGKGGFQLLSLAVLLGGVSAFLVGPSLGDLINGNSSHGWEHVGKRVGVLVGGTVTGLLVAAVGGINCATGGGDCAWGGGPLVLTGLGILVATGVTFVVLTVLDLIDQANAPGRIRSRR